MGLTLVDPLEEISLAAKGSRSVGLTSIDLHSSLEGLSGPLFLKGTPHVNDLKKEGVLASPSISVGEPKLFTLEGFELETTEGDVTLLYEKVACLRSRDAKLLSECEVAQVDTAWLQEDLEALQAEVGHLQASSREGNVQYLAIAEYLRSNVHQRREE
ncbi:hypothetical protein ACLOJK_007620 [Asimina triloba]